jgi:N-acetylneuraminic acid mutarotase
MPRVGLETWTRCLEATIGADKNTFNFPWPATMKRIYHLLLVIIALNVPAMGWDEEPAAIETKVAWPALEWKKAAPSPFARVESPAAVVDGRLYLFGGFTEDLGASIQVDVYDPAKDSWKRMKDMPVGLTHLNPAIDGKTIWFAGGFKGKHPGPVTDEVWKYDTATDAWTAGPPLLEPRAGGGVAVLGRKLHYFGGYKADRDTNAGDHCSLKRERPGSEKRNCQTHVAM